MTAQQVVGPYIDAIPVSRIFADPTYQRDVDWTRVGEMAEEFDRRLLGVLEVSARVDGRYAVLDGQHRLATVRKIDPECAIVCQVHESLTVQQEAELFHEINVLRRALSWWDRWRARRVACDPHVISVDAILERHRLQIHPSPADGNIRATKAVEKIVDLGDLTMLDSVLTVLTSAFGRSFDAFDGAIMQGVALVLANYDADEIDADRLVVQLRSIPPRQLRARAGALREIHRGTLPRLCAAVIVERYNAGRGGRRLEDFFARLPSSSKEDRASTQNRAARRRNQTAGTGTRPVSAAPPAPAAVDSSSSAGSTPTAAAEATADRVPVPARHGGTTNPAVPHPMLALCKCGHTLRRHDEGDLEGECSALSGECGCTQFKLAAS